MFQKLRNFLFQNKNIRQTVVKNVFWLSFGEIAGRVLRIGIVIYAARVLGAEGWGVFSYAVSLAALFTVFSDIGVSGILTREAAKNPELRSQYFATTLFLKLILTALSAFVIMFGAPYVTKIPLSQNLLLFVTLTFIFDALRSFGTALFRAVEKMEQEALVNIAIQAIILVAGLFAIAKFASPERLAIAYAIGAGGGMLATAYFLTPYLKETISRFNKALLKPIIMAAWPFSIAGMLSVIMINTDIVMLGWFRGAAEVGFYSAAQKPISFLYMLPSFIAGGLFPVLSRLTIQDGARFGAVLEKAIVSALLLALPAAIGIVLTAQDITMLFYGSEYAPATRALEILALTLLTTFPMTILTYALFAHNRQKEIVAFSGIGALSNVMLNSFFIPWWGIAGAAWATVITQTVNACLVWTRMKRMNNFTVLAGMKKGGVAAALMGIAVIALQGVGAPFLVIAPLAALTYFGTLLLLKEKMLADLRAIIES